MWRGMRREFWAAVNDAMGPPPQEVPVNLGYRIVLGLVLVAGVIVLAVGLASNPDGFFGNVVAEAAGVLFGAFLAVTLIESVLNQQRRAQWDVVRDEIVRSVGDALLAAVTDVVGTTGTGNAFLNAVGADTTLRIEVAEAMAQLPDELEAATQGLAAELDPSRASSRVTFTGVEAAFAPVRDLTTTRVVAMGDEPELVRLLLRLERRARDWRTGIELVETQNAPDLLAWQRAVATVRAATELYGYLARHP